MSSMVIAGPHGRRGVVVELRPAPVRPSVVRTVEPAARLRLTRRGRVVLAVLVALLVGMVATVFASVADADAPRVPQEVTVHTVSAGESLWQVAASVTTAGDDVRDTMDQVMDLNHLEGSQLAVGQQLVVPVRP